VIRNQRRAQSPRGASPDLCEERDYAKPEVANWSTGFGTVGAGVDPHFDIVMTTLPTAFTLGSDPLAMTFTGR
jgi:hypothetical protein